MAWQPLYASLAEAKDYLRIPADDNADDAQLNTCLPAASRAIDRFANRQFGKVDAPVARYYSACWELERRVWVARVDDVQNVVGLAVAFDAAGDGTFATTVTDFVLEPRNAAADGQPYTAIRFGAGAGVNDRDDAVRVTAAFGWTDVPVPIKEACLLQVSRLFKRRDAPFGIAGSPEMGSEMRLLNKLDPDVEVSVKPFQRVWGAV